LDLLKPALAQAVQGSFSQFILVKAASVFPGVHLFGDDVGFFADAAGEELSVLEQRCADLAEAVAGEDLAGDRLDVVPECGLGGKKIAGPADGFQG
jgi:hypothetical protein